MKLLNIVLVSIVDPKKVLALNGKGEELVLIH